MSTKINNIKNIDNFFMRLAYMQAKRSLGKTGMNPPVGCVITNKNNEIISVGRTDYKGRPHAEIKAIQKHNINLVNSNIYTTLEPCTHYGITKPCTNEIINKKIKKVIYSTVDPDLRTSNKAKKILRKNKIKVVENVYSKKINKFYRFYLKNKKKKIPFITAKLATSNDNFIKNIKSKTITNEYSRKTSHILRSKNDGILITAKTLIDDNPKLDCRILGLEKFSPTKIILDRNLITPLNSNIFLKPRRSRIIIFHNIKNNPKINLLRKKKVLTIFLDLDKKGKFNLKKIFNKLYELNISRLLIEGGKKFTEELLKNSLIDEFYLFRSDKKILSNGKINVSKLLKKINIKCKNKKNITTNLSGNTLTRYNF
tara:strand:- start:603 stop:1712 length:1110 start_codon:yes stop_codon:yes gene_type:complete